MKAIAPNNKIRPRARMALVLGTLVVVTIGLEVLVFFQVIQPLRLDRKNKSLSSSSSSLSSSYNKVQESSSPLPNVLLQFELLPHVTLIQQREQRHPQLQLHEHAHRRRLRNNSKRNSTSPPKNALNEPQPPMVRLPPPLYPRRRQRQQQQASRQVLEDPSEISTPQVPLWQGHGTHYLTVWIGHPIPQQQTWIVDTGSSVTAIPCVGYYSDSENDKNEDSEPPSPTVHHWTNPLFDPSLSSTFETLGCSGGDDECSQTFYHGTCPTTDNTNNNTTSTSTDCQIDMTYAEHSSWKARGVKDWVSFVGPPSQQQEETETAAATQTQENTSIDSSSRQ